MIYIDPPYNTGSGNDFVYPDNYAEGLRDYLIFTGQIDGAGRSFHSAPDKSGRFHSNWLNMMYPRLYLARNLLRNDGVVFVAIDDHEAHHLRSLMNEVFGEENFIASLVWEARSSISNDQVFSQNHNYHLIFARDINTMTIAGEPLDASEYLNPDNDPRGPWKPVPLDANKPGGDTRYAITNPNTGDAFLPPSARSWAINKATFEQLLSDGRISFGSNGRSAPKRKLYLNERLEKGDSKTPSTLLRDAGTTTMGTSELDALFGSRVFQYSKPTKLLRKLTSYGASDVDGIVLDFFAGSGTTGHAVMQQNVEDGGNRRYILVQLPEPLDEPKTLDDGTRLTTVADICRERVRRAGKKIAAESGKPVDTGFRAYRLAPSNFRPWDGRAPEFMTSARQASFMPQNRQLSMEERLLQAADHIRPDAEDDALLAELLLKIGFDLTTPVAKEQMAGKTVYNIENGTVLICLDRLITLDVIERMAARTPAEIICLDAGFPNDQTKVNAGQIIASHASDEETSIAFKVV